MARHGAGSGRAGGESLLQRTYTCTTSSAATAPVLLTVTETFTPAHCAAVTCVALSAGCEYSKEE